MAKVTVQVLGLRELGERMRTLERKMALKVARRATNAAAQIIKKSAQNHLRSNPSVDTGLLLKSVVVKRRGRSRLTSEHNVAVRPTPYPGTGSKGEFRNAATIGRFLEWGTAKMAPEPFLRPAFDENKDAALGAIVQTIDDGLKDTGR